MAEELASASSTTAKDTQLSLEIHVFKIQKSEGDKNEIASLKKFDHKWCAVNIEPSYDTSLSLDRNTLDAFKEATLVDIRPTIEKEL